MDITLPTIPAGVLVLLALLVPYLQAIIQRPSWRPWVKRVIAVALALILAAVVLAFYYVYTGDVVPGWPVLVLLAIVVAQASYAMLTRDTAATLERTLNAGSNIGPDTLRRDLR
jgi:peptidoglycan/LPS O-acetylase OafA/YrhL